MTGAGAATRPYASPPIQGRVVDETTGAPLASAAVLALWKARPDVSQPMLINTLHMEETASAPDGTFVVPGWSAPSLPAPIDDQSLALVGFVPGYEVGWHAGAGTPAVIRLTPFAGPPAARAQHLHEQVATLVLFVAPLGRRAPPLMVRAIDAEWQRLPDDVRQGMSSLIPGFEAAAQELRDFYNFERLKP